MDRQLLGRWDVSENSIHGPLTAEIKNGRSDWVFNYFGGPGGIPWYIWRVEFWGEADKSVVMVLHRFASHPEHGGRYATWVRAYDEHGDGVTTKLVAAVEPEEYPVTTLPPENLLFGNVE